MLNRLPLLVSAIALAALAWPAASQAAPDEPPFAAAKAIYAASCASCHGKDLHGGGASSLADGIWQYGGGGQIRRNIAFGIAEAGMPAYGEELSDREIRQLIAYIDDAHHQAQIPKPELPKVIATRDYDLRVTPVAEGLNVPWAITFLNRDTALITERGGSLRLLEGAHRDAALHPTPIANTPAVVAAGQGGLLDVVADPAYADNGWIYLTYSHALPEDVAADAAKPRRMTRVVRGRIRDHAWVDHEVLWEARAKDYSGSRFHFGSRIAFSPEGHLYFSVGDRGGMNRAQKLTVPSGKIHRIHPDGSIPQDNPFVADGPEVYSSIYTLGNRNPQGLATHPVTGDIWETEHGPQGGDEVNRIIAGANYGWPIISYGINYSGSVLTERTAQEGLQQPVWYWKPSIAACGLTFYQGDALPRWRNDLFAGGLSYETLVRLVVVDNRVIHQEEILKNLGRVRDVQTGPDGALYVVLNGPDTVIRLSHQSTRNGAGDGNAHEKPARP